MAGMPQPGLATPAAVAAAAAAAAAAGNVLQVTFKSCKLGCLCYFIIFCLAYSNWTAYLNKIELQ